MGFDPKFNHPKQLILVSWQQKICEVFSKPRSLNAQKISSVCFCWCFIFFCTGSFLPPWSKEFQGLRDWKIGSYNFVWGCSGTPLVDYFPSCSRILETWKEPVDHDTCFQCLDMCFVVLERQKYRAKKHPLPEMCPKTNNNPGISRIFFSPPLSRLFNHHQNQQKRRQQEPLGCPRKLGSMVSKLVISPTYKWDL